MASFLGVANAALANLAEEPIDVDAAEAQVVYADLDPTDDIENAVRVIYPQVRHALMNSHPWTWASVQEPLAAAVPHERDRMAMPETMAWPYRYRYVKPEQLIGNIRALYDRVDGPALTEEWRPLGAFVYAEFPDAIAAYQRDLDEAAWPTLFENAMVLRLAARLAMPVKEDVESMRVFSQMADDALQMAKAVDSQSHPAEGVSADSFDWVTARVTGFSGRRHRVGY